MTKLFSIKDLFVEFDTYGGIVHAVRGAKFEVDRGETLAIVGESGCGKSVSVLSSLGLIPMPPGRIKGGSVTLDGREILGLQIHELNYVRGKEIGFIFQDPMVSLNPTLTVGYQIAERLWVHEKLSKKEAMLRAVKLLERVQIPEPNVRVNQYPFELSGGMRQRVMIAIAIACEPKVLIADEPTTALDVTIQAQILNLLKDLQESTGMALILITHDLGVVAKCADRVSVMYAGQVVESGTVDAIFYESTHPYTLGLKAALPGHDRARKSLVPIEGSPPDLFHPPAGCGYFARCPSAMRICESRNPEFYIQSSTHSSRCFLHDPAARGAP